MIIEISQIKEDFRVSYDGSSYMPQKGTIIKDSKVPELIGTLHWTTLGYYSKLSSAIKKIIPLVILDRHEKLTLDNWLDEYRALVKTFKNLID